jgi:hypothetical protein
MRRSRLRLRALWPVLLLWLSACAHTFTVEATVARPARVPVHVFPSIWVAGGENQEEVYLLDRVASHLARDARREVRRVEDAELEPARAAGQISWLTAVVRLKVGFRADERSELAAMPMQYCGMFGCSMMTYQTYSTLVPVLHGDATLTVYEGPTARELSRETFTETLDGDRSDEARREITERLADTLMRAVDVSLARERFRVQESGIAQADLGVRALARGQFREARQQLEEAKKLLGGKKREIQARVWHALGVARLLDKQPKGPSERDFVDAERVLQLAYQLAPSKLRHNTLQDLATWRKQEEALAQQEYAQTHNFGLRTQEAPPPTAPAPSAPK